MTSRPQWPGSILNNFASAWNCHMFKKKFLHFFTSIKGVYWVVWLLRASVVFWNRVIKSGQILTVILTSVCGSRWNRHVLSDGAIWINYATRCLCVVCICVCACHDIWKRTWSLDQDSAAPSSAGETPLAPVLFPGEGGPSDLFVYVFIYLFIF